MQKLYEQHKVLTYPRTDSRFLSTDMVDTLKERLQAVSIKPYAQYASRILRSPIKANKSFVDDARFLITMQSFPLSKRHSGKTERQRIENL